MDHRYQAALELTGFATLSDLQGIVSVNNIPCKFQRSHQHQIFLQQNLKRFYLQPRANEAGGRYGRGVITRKYRKGQSIKVILNRTSSEFIQIKNRRGKYEQHVQVRIELTANHMGHFEFRLCPNNNPAKPATQACLDRLPNKKTQYELIGFNENFTPLLIIS